MRKMAIALLAALALMAPGNAPARADNDCFSCWAGASILLGGIRIENEGYPNGYLPGIHSPYYGYAPGYYRYPPPHAHLPGHYAPRRHRSVRYANKVRYVQPAAFDPARINR